MKTVLVTGATGGIGEAIALKFRQQNYQVIAPKRDEMNLLNPDSIQDYLSRLKQAIHVFVHCAGMNDPKLIDRLTEADIQQTFQVNTLSFYSICKHLSSHFKAENAGHVLAVSSIYGHLSRKARLAYASAKHALNGMVKTLALELGPHNIKVNALSPGFIDTQLTRKNNSPAVIEDLRQKIPLARLGTPEEMAEIAYFLCSPQNNYINGQCIIADGGYSVGGFQA